MTCNLSQSSTSMMILVGLHHSRYSGNVYSIDFFFLIPCIVGEFIEAIILLIFHLKHLKKCINKLHSACISNFARIEAYKDKLGNPK